MIRSSTKTRSSPSDRPAYRRIQLDHDDPILPRIDLEKAQITMKGYTWYGEYTVKWIGTPSESNNTRVKLTYDDYPRSDTYYYANANQSWFYLNPDGTRFYHNGDSTCWVDVPSGLMHAIIYAAYKRFERADVLHQGLEWKKNTGDRKDDVKREEKDEDGRHCSTLDVPDSDLLASLYDLLLG